MYNNLEGIVKQVLSLDLVKENNYLSSNARDIVKQSYTILEKLNNLTNECWIVLKDRFSTFRLNLEYFKSYGGYCPSNKNILEFRDNVVELDNIKSLVKNNIKEITSYKSWIYDIGYSKYLDKLKELLEINN